MRQVALAVSIDFKGFVFDTGHQFRGLTISENGAGYNCVVRGTASNGEPVYAMTTAEDPQAGLDSLYQALARDSKDTLWRLDRFASARGGG